MSTTMPHVQTTLTHLPVGAKVYIIVARDTTERTPCVECAGERFLAATTATGKAVHLPCSECKGSGWKAGKARKCFDVKPATVTQIRWEMPRGDGLVAYVVEYAGDNSLSCSERAAGVTLESCASVLVADRHRSFSACFTAREEAKQVAALATAESDRKLGFTTPQPAAPVEE